MTTYKNRERRFTIVSLSSNLSNNNSNNFSNSFKNSFNAQSFGSILNNNNNNNNNNNTLASISGLGEEEQANLEDSVSTISHVLSIVDLEKDMLFIKRCMKQQVKQLVKLLLLFTLYIVSGMFVFFYIEECSGGSKPGDNSYLHSDIIANGEFTDMNNTCTDISEYLDTLYNKTYNSFNRTNNITNTSSSSVYTNGSLSNFNDNNTDTSSIYTSNNLHLCQVELKNATDTVIVLSAKKPNCVVDEFSLLKYAEFTVFTCLTIGKS